LDSKYPLQTIGDVCDLGDGAHAKVGRVDRGVPYLTSKNIGDGRLKLDDVDYISESDFERLFSPESKAVTRLKPGDLLTGIIGTFGNSYLYKEEDRFGIASAVAILRPRQDSLFPKYLYYYVTSPFFRAIHRAFMGGSVQGYTNLPTIRRLPIIIPPLAEQKAIAAMLGALDDKIELNRRMDATLEAMARVLFQSWFVDFDPVRAKLDGCQPTGLDPSVAELFPNEFEDSELGAIPKGWKVMPLPKAIEINPRRRLQPGMIAPYLDMKNMPTHGHCPDNVIQREFTSGNKFQNGDTLLARITPCLENGKTAFVDFLNDGQIGWGSTEYLIFAPKPPLPPQLGYLLARSESLRTHAIQNMTGTSGRQRVPAECFDSYLVVVPPSKIAARFGQIAAPMFEKIRRSVDESHMLAAIRDTLLPKLLDGKVFPLAST
jgi:type I restriction enzyme, S subunit